MADIVLKIDSARLDFAVGVIIGAGLSKTKITDDVINSELTGKGYSAVEIMLSRQMIDDRLQEIQNPTPPAKRGRKKVEDKDNSAYEQQKAEYLANQEKIQANVESTLTEDGDYDETDDSLGV